MKKAFLSVGILAFVFFASAVCLAGDIIEVKGNKLMSGKIVKESENEVVFLGPDGITQTIPRDQITMIEKGSASLGSVTPKTQDFSFSTTRGSASGPTLQLSGVSGNSLEQVRQMIAEKASARAKSKDMLTKINLGIERVYMQQAFFFVPDAEAFGKTALDAFAQVQKKQGGLSQGIAALVLGILGFILLMVSGLMVLISAFRCGIGWGLVILTNGIVNFLAVRFGESVVLVSHLWPLLITYLVVTRFREMRRSMLFVMISIILLLSALLVVRIGFLNA